MKRSIIFAIVSSPILFSVFKSCKKPVKKDINAIEDNIEEAAQNLGKAAKQTQEEIKTDIEADWEKFRSESEIAIDNTETEIKSLREKIAIAGNQEREELKEGLDTLEQKNKKLKERLAERSRKFKENLIEFNETAKEKQEEFEREFQHDIKELGAALKNLFKDNVD